MGGSPPSRSCARRGRPYRRGHDDTDVADPADRAGAPAPRIGRPRRHGHQRLPRAGLSPRLADDRAHAGRRPGGGSRRALRGRRAQRRAHGHAPTPARRARRRLHAGSSLRTVRAGPRRDGSPRAGRGRRLHVLVPRLDPGRRQLEEPVGAAADDAGSSQDLPAAPAGAAHDRRSGPDRPVHDATRRRRTTAGPPARQSAPADGREPLTAGAHDAVGPWTSPLAPAARRRRPRPQHAAVCRQAGADLLPPRGRRAGSARDPGPALPHDRARLPGQRLPRQCPRVPAHEPGNRLHGHVRAGPAPRERRQDHRLRGAGDPRAHGRRPVRVARARPRAAFGELRPTADDRLGLGLLPRQLDRAAVTWAAHDDRLRPQDLRGLRDRPPDRPRPVGARRQAGSVPARPEAALLRPARRSRPPRRRPQRVRQRRDAAARRLREAPRARAPVPARHGAQAGATCPVRRLPHLVGRRRRPLAECRRQRALAARRRRARELGQHGPDQRGGARRERAVQAPARRLELSRRARGLARPPGRPPRRRRAPRGGTVEVWASWNGATHVRRWRVLAGPEPDRLGATGAGAAFAGLETRMLVRTDSRMVAVQAIGSDGEVLATSAPISVRDAAGRP